MDVIVQVVQVIAVAWLIQGMVFAFCVAMDWNDRTPRLYEAPPGALALIERGHKEFLPAPEDRPQPAALYRQLLPKK